MAPRTVYADVQRLLDDSVGNAELPTHGAFWRTLTRDAFVVHRVFKCPLISSDANGRFVGPDSPLVRILRGPIECPAGRPRPRMPVGLDPMPDANIQIISDWIDDQCPA